MKKSFWVFLILSAALVIFSVQNAEPVDVNIFFSQVEISLAILLIIVFLTGVIAGASYFFIKSKIKKQPKPEPEIIEESSEADVSE
ncbi:LapA family protein [Carboxylicivirga sp. A043]|uniref:LapA family protein n=1 Tax=Carboxylicivirga litoralis TaxID=2816963 RepID=UPI0021CB4E29|nr:LapA family protein [Carboxylicivirga sp. A043]MCU4157593.1 LapA family protein [Carboxylicivirga sp. A043]